MQGYELQVLFGAKKTLNKNRNIIVHIEFWPEGLKRADTKLYDLINFITKLGFKSFVIDEDLGSQIYMKNISKIIEFAYNNPAGFSDILCKR